jgi:arabinose-5-phosphate isomerase
VLLEMPDVAEACPNGLAPTSSTTMALALGDALTIVLMARRGFSREEFGFRHPGGKLGRSLQTAGDYIETKTDHMPIISASADVRDVILAVSEGRKGCVGVVDADGRLVGMVTDGDLRRAMLAGKLAGTAVDVMTPDPKALEPRRPHVCTVIKTFTEQRISNAFVTVDGKPVGIIDMKDLLAEGYV